MNTQKAPDLELKGQEKPSNKKMDLKALPFNMGIYVGTHTRISVYTMSEIGHNNIIPQISVVMI